MNKLYSLRNLLLTLIISLISLSIQAGTGDTTVVHGFNNFLHQNCNTGNSSFLFPPDSMSFYKIMLRYELSCPPGGCDTYDRIATLKVMKHTGQMDSTIILAPSFKVDGASPDSLQFMFTASYQYSYNTLTHLIDSIAYQPLQLILFNDHQNPQVATDTLQVWPAYYNQYQFDSLGVATDSVFVVPDSVIYLTNDSIYHPFEIIEPYEIARAITPYGEGVVLWFDVSDYRMLLHDSVYLNSVVCGYQYGWQVTTDFYFIEGVPPLHPYKIFNLWNGTWQYGKTSDPINNHLPAITLQLDTQTVYEKVRLITTGHGFGCSPNQNVAEFYNVVHSLVINGTSMQQRLWRSDCGRNSLYPQGAPGYTSTWFYKRANWCPGSYVTPHDYNATPYSSGDTLRVDYNMANYTVTSCPSGAYHPEYYIQSHAFFYDDIHYHMNSAIQEVRRPNDAFEFNRYNPICETYNPQINIKNYGADTLHQLTVHYGIDGNYTATYNWTGSLNFLDTTTIQLPPVAFTAGQHTFDVYTDLPNMGADEFAFDDTMHTTFTATNVYNTNFIVIKLTTDNNPAQSVMTVRDAAGTVVFTHSGMNLANHQYVDTVVLSNGCYNFTITDSYGDGVCCYDGTGTLRLYQGSSFNALFNSGDFGEFYSWNFTLDNTAGIDNNTVDREIFVYPNPASSFVNLNTSFESGNVRIEVLDVMGRTVAVINSVVSNHFANFDLPEMADGIYYLRIAHGKDVFVEKVVVGR